MSKTTSIMIALLGCSLYLMAQSADSTLLRPSFGVDYTGEMQTDFESVRLANLLQFRAEIPLSKGLSFQVASVSTLSTNKELEVIN